jgi:transposase, IS5 family
MWICEEKVYYLFAINREIVLKTLQKNMLSKNKNERQIGTTFEEQLSHQHPLYVLASKIRWDVFEQEFGKLYSREGRPAAPIRLMVSLLMLKHIRNLSDESVVNNG